ncbi:CbbY [Rhodomicrobium udaipurense JA643]|uniref:HAD family hydrolase n=1 Tax=Rhodomicrobium udaipurense TaxID=1202716 RepID=A0A8I1KM77_9HYPH|nr:HAD family hydrolase [Rhodomicrobium udaipurense]KAI93362.1 CbbY [Rhodomicrobium udaipurense JA643]MBJ7544858.1 HAD family hydrolase [Rhodomicrobium udaipurense]
MAELKALIFDVDGTLAETEEGHRLAFNRAFADAGLDWAWPPALYAELLAVTGGKERIAHYIARHRPDFTPPTGQPLPEFIAVLHAAKTKHYAALLAGGGIPLRPGVARLLREAKDAGVRLAIATTTSPENVTALFDATMPEALGWFEVIGAGDAVPRKKPAPDIYLYVLAALRLPPADCLAIEDSAPGTHAARDAGLQVIATLNDYTASHDFDGAMLLLNHLGEPGFPFKVLSGNANSCTFIDIELLRKLVRTG